MNGFRPDIPKLVDNAYEEVLATLYDAGFFGGKSWIDVQAEQPDVMPRLRCAMPDFATKGQCKWPMLAVTHASRVELPGLTPAQITAAFREACQAWNAVCGIQLAISDDYERANIYAHSGKIDGRSGTLAWSYLPCGASRTSRMEQLYDSAESWSYNWLVEVAAHEIGHAIGLSHGPKGSLMYAYSGGGSVRRPQTWDIAEAVARYGKPQTPPPSGFDPADLDGVMVIRGIPYPVTDSHVTIDGRPYLVTLSPP